MVTGGSFAEVIAGLVAVAQCGFGYEAVKGIAASIGWRLDGDEPEFGYVTYQVPTGITATAGESRLCVLFRREGQAPKALLPLFASEQFEDDRPLFDSIFAATADRIAGVLGPRSSSGQYEYGHRVGWQYRYTTWAGAGATLVLVQDEFDIQFGMDVTLWTLPAGTPVKFPLHD